MVFSKTAQYCQECKIWYKAEREENGCEKATSGFFLSVGTKDLQILYSH